MLSCTLNDAAVDEKNGEPAQPSVALKSAETAARYTYPARMVPPTSMASEVVVSETTCADELFAPPQEEPLPAGEVSRPADAARAAAGHPTRVQLTTPAVNIIPEGVAKEACCEETLARVCDTRRS